MRYIFYPFCAKSDNILTLLVFWKQRLFLYVNSRLLSLRHSAETEIPKLNFFINSSKVISGFSLICAVILFIISSPNAGLRPRLCGFGSMLPVEYITPTFLFRCSGLLPNFLLFSFLSFRFACVIYKVFVSIPTLFRHFLSVV